jgi:hypothetical protein
MAGRTWKRESSDSSLLSISCLESTNVLCQRSQFRHPEQEQSFISADRIDLDPFMSSQTRERTLNAAIIQANISESFEEYLEIFDAFYADDIEVSSETAKEPIRGKGRVRSILANFLVPLHVMAEVGGLSISIRQTAIAGDVADETHSAWTLDLVGVSGRACTVTWRALRKWNGSRVASITMTSSRTGAP